ncbi:hypothetical protein LEMLEM_LOCUS3591, partial [Lemmus lemmus]
HSFCRGQGRAGIDNEPCGMRLRQKDENMAGVFCISPKKKTDKEEAMGKGCLFPTREREGYARLAMSEEQQMAVGFRGTAP